MYDELILELRKNAEFLKLSTRYDNTKNEFAERILQAVDAIEELQQQVEHYNGCMNDWFQAAQEYKAGMSRWIPVTERMPEEGKYVLVYGKELHPNPHASQIEVSKVYDGNYWSGFGRTGKITHWMLLPEPPKEET